MSKPSNHPTKMGHVTPGGGTPAREQPIHRYGGPTLGGGTPTSADTSILGGTSTQKYFSNMTFIIPNDILVAYMIIKSFFIYLLC